MNTKIENVELTFSKEFQNNNDTEGSLSLNICGMEEEDLPAAISINFNKKNGEGISAILEKDQVLQLKASLTGYLDYLK